MNTAQLYVDPKAGEDTRDSELQARKCLSKPRHKDTTTISDQDQPGQTPGTICTI